jgi:hypothetical protein
MYVNGEMRPAEAIPRTGAGNLKENNGGGEFKYVILVRTFVNSTMYPYPVQ